MTTYVDVAISDLFSIINGKPKYIRDYLDANPGPYPVYSASLVKPFGFIEGFDFDGIYLSWVMNGYGGRMQTLAGQFSINRDRGILIPREGKTIPNLTYLRHAMEPELISSAVGRRVDGKLNEYTKIYPPIVAEVTIRIPIRADGKFDFNRMDEIGKRLDRIEAAQSVVATARESLEGASLAFSVTEPTLALNLGDKRFFTLTIGDRVLKSQFSKDGIDVYSANARHPFGKIATSNLTDFSKPSLLWGIDGVFDWNLIPAGVEFATTDHCGRLQFVADGLHPEYVLEFLRATRSEYGFDRVYRASLTNIAEQVYINFPIDKHGHISLEQQIDFANERKRILNAQLKTLTALNQVMQARMAIEL